MLINVLIGTQEEACPEHRVMSSLSLEQQVWPRAPHPSTKGPRYSSTQKVQSVSYIISVYLSLINFHFF